MTIRHLLTHTSGLGYGVIDGDERFRKIYHKAGITDLFTTEDIAIAIGESVQKLARLPLHHNPGEAYTWQGNGKHYGLAFGVVHQKGQDMGSIGSK